MKTYDEEYLRVMGKMERPIPGQSLTNDPESPLPFEGPPVFTKKREALEHIFNNMTRPEVYEQVMETVAQGTAITDVSQTILMKGFQEGKWNPDMFLMLLEPTMYMTMALAERANIDYTIDGSPDDPEAIQDSELSKRVAQVKEKLTKGSAVKPGVLPKEIEEKIEQIAPPTPKVEAESLITRPERTRIQDTDLAAEAEASLIPRPSK